MKKLFAGSSHFKRQHGSVALVITLTLTVIMAFAGLGADVGYVLYNQKRLQAATDAAALAGAADLWTSPFTTAQANALAYSAGAATTPCPLA
jgi:uncharacterized membrane protein